MNKVTCINVTYESVPVTTLADAKQPDSTCLRRVEISHQTSSR